MSWFREQLQGQLAGSAPIYGAYLVGSWARGEGRESALLADEGSDIDLVLTPADPKRDNEGWDWIEGAIERYHEQGFTRPLDIRVAQLNQSKPYVEVWMQGNPQTVGGGP